MRGGESVVRVLRGLGAFVVLLLVLAGVPWALVMLGGNPLPADLSWATVWQALFTPDDGTLLIGAITLVGWVAWLVFALSVLSELVALASHRRIRIRLPGLAGPQRLAGSLLIAVIALAAIPQLSQPAPAAPVVATTAPTAVQRPGPDPAPEVQPAALPTRVAPVAAAASGDHPARHTVKVGDDLWSLAERYYGQGRDWRKIAAANPDLLSGGPDRLTPGWRLIIPDLAAPEPATEEPTVTVRRGDTLSAIAERELGSAGEWRAIYRLNRAQLSDPDELATGMGLVMPAADVAPTSEVQDEAAAAGSTPETPTRPRRAETDPTAETPAPSAPASPAPTSTDPKNAEAGPSVTSEAEDERDLAWPLAGVGGLLAAGLVGGLASRRRLQLQLRPLGRRIPGPPAPAQAVEVALGRRQRPLSLRTLDRALRAIGAHCHATSTPLPPLQLARVSDDVIELILAAACPEPPVGFTVRGRSWLLSRADADYLSSVPGLAEAGRPWPALVTLGHDEQDRLVLADLESLGLLQLDAASPPASVATPDETGVDLTRADPGPPGTGRPVVPAGVLAAMAVELSFSPWAEEMILTLVGSCDRLPEALGKHNITRTDDVDGLLTRLEQRARVQRAHHPQAVLAQHRVDPDLADPWAPEIVLVNAPLSEHQRSRLAAVVSAEPRVTMAAVVVGPGPAPWSFELGRDGGPSSTLSPAGLRLTPQWLEPSESEAVIDLVECTGSELTTPAPWWSHPAQQPGPPPDNVTYLGKRFGGWGPEDGDDHVGTPGEGAVMATVTTATVHEVHHPTLQLLGPVELLGATGTPPPRAGKQCLEYCAWLLEHPGTTAQAMANALAVAEGTRRSNMSRLRGWLGDDEAGLAYLPDAYTGRIVLHSSVSSDWQRLQILTATGVNRAGTSSLRAALELVRGAPLADAAPGQWHWAEQLRTDMISCVRDIGVELVNRALGQGEVDLARWAAARALVAAPGDELLLAGRIRTEHLAGNAADTERLTLQLAAQARTLGLDLDPETVILLQQVVEGRVRARMA